MIRQRLKEIRVYVSPLNRSKGWLQAGEMRFSCALGHSGAGLKQREGDGFSPLGVYGLRRLHVRADKEKRPQTGLPIRNIKPTDWWCDDPQDRSYNKLVKNRPIPKLSKEGLFRKDDLYDLVVEIGYNDAPAIKYKGSGIFIHLAREGMTPTQGCVALTYRALRRILPLIGPKTKIRIG